MRWFRHGIAASLLIVAATASAQIAAGIEGGCTAPPARQCLKPEYNSPYPGDVITTPLDPIARALLARFPTLTNPSAAANSYTRTVNDADHQNQFDF